MVQDIGFRIKNDSLRVQGKILRVQNSRVRVIAFGCSV
jgi:hypothetical protein